MLLESLRRGRCGENGSGETGKVSERSEMLLIFLLVSLVWWVPHALEPPIHHPTRVWYVAGCKNPGLEI